MDSPPVPSPFNNQHAEHQKEKMLTICEITTLAHELRNNSVELAALEVEGLASLSNTLLTSGEGSEIFCSLGDCLSI